MPVYPTKKRVIIRLVAICLFLSGVSVFLHFFRHDFKALVPAFGFLFFAVLFLQAKPKVVTTSEGIKKRVFSIEQTCKWDSIYHIKTYLQTRTGDYWTVLSWAQKPEFRKTAWKEMLKLKPKSGIMIVTEQLENYPALVKEIKEQATHAESDMITDNLAQTGRTPER